MITREFHTLGDDVKVTTSEQGQAHIGYFKGADATSFSREIQMGQHVRGGGQEPSLRGYIGMSYIVGKGSKRVKYLFGSGQGNFKLDLIRLNQKENVLLMTLQCPKLILIIKGYG